MEVIVGSKNLPKHRAVANIFRQVFPGEFLEIQGVAAESEVASHPTSAEESLKGAFNRIKNAKLVRPDADYYVGIEGGLLRVGEKAWEHSWVAIEDKNGRTHTGISAGLELQGRLLQAILNGQELGEAFEEQFGVKEARKKNGLYGIATDNVVTRETATTQAVTFALAPFKHPEYFQ